MADEALAEALSRKPLLVTLMRQGTAKRGAAAPQPVPLGTAEVDLTSLLRPRYLPHLLDIILYRILSKGMLYQITMIFGILEPKVIARCSPMMSYDQLKICTFLGQVGCATAGEALPA